MIRVVVPCICITVLLIVALCQGIDGILLSGGLTLIAGIAGFEIKALKERKKRNGKRG